MIVSSSENPLKVGIFNRVQDCESVSRAHKNSLGDVAIHIAKHVSVSSQTSHHETGEKSAKEKAPAQVVPFESVKRFTLGLRPAAKQLRDALPRVRKRQNPVTEHGKIALEPPH